MLLNPTTGASQLAAGNLNAAVDAIADPNSTGVLVLENSGGPQGLGQLLAVDAAGTAPQILATGLNDPTSLSMDAFSGRVFVYSRGDGVVYAVPVR